jgi:hypothetical protein
MVPDVATIHKPQLVISTDRPHDQATVTLSSDVEFTEVEVNAMNVLGLRYTLHCELLDMDMLYEPADVPFGETRFPSVGRTAKANEHVELEASAPMHVLHRFVFGKDSLLAELTLCNEETGAVTTARSNVLHINLAV